LEIKPRLLGDYVKKDRWGLQHAWGNRHDMIYDDTI